MADYLLVFRAPGENAEPVWHMPPYQQSDAEWDAIQRTIAAGDEPEYVKKTNPREFSVEQWQKWASPVWMDIRQTNTLNATVVRQDADERHLCPLQLDLIERCLVMWSNSGDIVLSPFMGIGSEGVMAVRHKRKFLGVELKEAYWRQACKHLADEERHAPSLFDIMAAD